MSIAVLGAGMAGCCVALELANRGQHVILYDRRDKPMQEASRWCEGKVHLGLVYANDPSFRTAQAMIDGALAFTNALQRWIPLQNLDRYLSDPFEYPVLRDSMLPPDQIEAHFSRVADKLSGRRNAGGTLNPLIPDGPVFKAVDPKKSGFDPAHVVACYKTGERAIDTLWLADRLSAAVMEHPRIECLVGHHVLEIIRQKSMFRVRCQHEKKVKHDGPFNHLVNALWANRLKLDATLGNISARPAINRLKLGVNIWNGPEDPGVPSSTFVLGPYGDMVKFPSGRNYLSWYPAGMFGVKDALHGIDWQERLGSVNTGQVLAETLTALKRLAPGFNPGMPWNGCASRENSNQSPTVVIEGGAIFAWGKTDIDDPDSELHRRYEIGPHDHAGCISLDSGKLTTIPLFSLQTADLVAPMAIQHTVYRP